MAARAPTHFYVYYRVNRDTSAARSTIGALLAEVEARTGVVGRLLARRDDPSTWMEVYEPVGSASAFARTLEACVRRLGASAVAADGIRHSECFAALDAHPARRSRRTV